MNYISLHATSSLSLKFNILINYSYMSFLLVDPYMTQLERDVLEGNEVRCQHLNLSDSVLGGELMWDPV